MDKIDAPELFQETQNSFFQIFLQFYSWLDLNQSLRMFLLILIDLLGIK